MTANLLARISIEFVIGNLRGLPFRRLQRIHRFNWAPPPLSQPAGYAWHGSDTAPVCGRTMPGDDEWGNFVGLL